MSTRDWTCPGKERHHIRALRPMTPEQTKSPDECAVREGPAHKGTSGWRNVRVHARNEFISIVPSPFQKNRPENRVSVLTDIDLVDVRFQYDCLQCNSLSPAGDCLGLCHLPSNVAVSNNWLKRPYHRFQCLPSRRLERRLRLVRRDNLGLPDLVMERFPDLLHLCVTEKIQDERPDEQP